MTWNNQQHPEWFRQHNENVVDLAKYKADKAKGLIQRVLGVFGDTPIGQITGTVLEIHPEEKI